MGVDSEFRAKITGSPEEKAYDVSKYKKPENPVLPEYGGVKLAANDEEYLLLELLPSVANGFLKRRRAEEWKPPMPPRRLRKLPPMPPPKLRRPMTSL